MQPQQSAQLLLSQISALDEAIGERLSQSLPSKILLHMFVAERETKKAVNQGELNNTIDAPMSIFERYVKVLVSEGLIEMCQENLSQHIELRLSELTKKRLEAIFHSSK